MSVSQRQIDNDARLEADKLALTGAAAYLQKFKKPTFHRGHLRRDVGIQAEDVAEMFEKLKLRAAEVKVSARSVGILPHPVDLLAHLLKETLAEMRGPILSAHLIWKVFTRRREKFFGEPNLMVDGLTKSPSLLREPLREDLRGLRSLTI